MYFMVLGDFIFGEFGEVVLKLPHKIIDEGAVGFHHIIGKGEGVVAVVVVETAEREKSLGDEGSCCGGP